MLNSIKSLKLITLGYNKNCETGGTPRSSTKYQKEAFFLFLFFFFYWVPVVVEEAFNHTNHANSQWLWSFLDSFFGSFPLSPLSFLRGRFPLAILGRQNVVEAEDWRTRIILIAIIGLRLAKQISCWVTTMAKIRRMFYWKM